jgi:N-acetylglucosamine kinase-like BadF-type ATPase
MNRHVLGIDGGGTKTLATICDAHGRVLGVGLGGPSNIDDVGLEAATANIAQAVNAARAQAKLEPAPFEAAFLGLAGIVSERDRELVRSIAQHLELAAPARTGVDHDCRIALAGGLSGRPGIVLIVGTGSSCYGINANGESWRAGGWGSLISDEGSGYFLGLESLRSTVRALDGRGPTTKLAATLLEHLGVLKPDDLLHRIYVTGLSRSEIAALAPLVLEVAGHGDAVALDLLERGATLLAECVKTVAQRLHLEQHDIAVVGGLYTSSELVRTPLHRAIREHLPAAKITAPELSPVLGACLLAIEMLGPITPDVIAQLKQENPK